MNIDISIFIGNHKNTTKGEIYGFGTFEELSDEFKSCAKGGKFSAYFVRGKLDPVERLDKNLNHSNLLIIDADDGTNGPLCSPEVVHDRLVELELNHFIYTSHSHRADKNKFRCVVECETYTKLELKKLNAELLKLIDRDIKYVKEMNTWSQPWFIPTRDDPTDGLFRYYRYTDGKAYECCEEEVRGSSGERTNDEKTDRTGGDGDGEDLDTLFENIRTGREFHASLRTLSYQNAKDGMSYTRNVSHIRHLLSSADKDEIGMERWQTRYDNIERLVQGAYDRIDSESDFELEEEVVDRLIPDIPMPPGLMGQLCQNSYNGMMIQHHELALMSSMGVLAAICGRKFNHMHDLHPRTGQPSTPMGLNIYMTIVGSTGIGKSALEKFAKWIFNTVNDGKHRSFMGPSAFTGQKALVDTLTLQRSIVSVSTEAGLMLQSKSGDMSGLLRARLNLYGQSAYNSYSDGQSFSDKDKNVPSLRAPAFSQLSESVPDSLYQALKETNSLDNGLLPRQTLLVIPDYRTVKRNFHAMYELDKEVEQRLVELMEVASQVQAEADPNAIYVTYEDDKMRKEAEDIMDKSDAKRGVDSAEGIMATRMPPKVFKNASLVSLMNNGLSGLVNNTIHIDWESWEWAKDMLKYEEKINSVFLDNMAGGDDIQEAIDVVSRTLKQLLLGKHNSKKAQDTVSKQHRDYKVVSITTLRNVLAKNPSIKALNSGAQGWSIKTGLDKVLEYMEKMGKVTTLKKSPVTGRKAQMIKVLESIND